ncbi:unnamed protein product [Coffea canephora]|uniref:Uncharacterized protein n=1 Tax=Coffea canephora TaxID=49390 RepID=A0A068UCF9_COFCA|nr:unnamed protein product [Coffea canephora]
MEAILIGYDLQKFIDGSCPPLPPTINTNDIVSSNPAYQTWLCQDKLLLGTLVGTLSPSLVPLITQSQSSLEAWQTLANTYACLSRGYIKQLRDNLKHITKGIQSITEYMQSIKTQANELAALGKPLDHEDLVEKASAHATTTQGPPTSRTSRAACPFLGRCQWCSIQGHVVSRCPLFRQQFSHAQPPSRHTASSFSVTSPPWQAQAHVATHPTSDTLNTPWLLDSGATYHVSTDLRNLALHSPYHGTDEIMIGDGSGLPISHTGSISFNTPFFSFTLSNVLCVPTTKRNLIFISQFCKSNNTSIEFLPSSFCVKDLHTEALILQGRTKNRVYEWPTSISKSPLLAFSSVKAPLPAWHHRLGHPSLSTFKHILSIHKLPFSSSSLSTSSPLEVVFTDIKALVEKFFA